MAENKAKEPIPANRLKALRNARELTQEDLAERCGTTHSTIQRLESRKRQLTSHWVYKLAKALNCHPGELFEELPDPGLSSTERWLMDAHRRASNTEKAFIEAAAHLVPEKPSYIQPDEPAKRAS